MSVLDGTYNLNLLEIKGLIKLNKFLKIKT